jgi:DNA polymerase-4
MSGLLGALEASLISTAPDRGLFVTGTRAHRGVVTAASGGARRHGVRAGMPLEEAKRRCPAGEVLRARVDSFDRVRDHLDHLLEPFSPAVEASSSDVMVLTLERVRGAGVACRVAQRLRARLLDRFPDAICAIGIGSNRLLARVAAEGGASAEIAELDVARFRESVWPRPVTVLPCLTPAMARRLGQDMGVVTVGQLARADVRGLLQRFGLIGPELHRAAWGYDGPAPEVVRSAPQVVEAASPVDGTRPVDDLLFYLGDTLGQRLRIAACQGKRVVLKVDLAEGSTVIRGCGVAHPVDQAVTIFWAARALLRSAAVPSDIRRIALAVEDLERRPSRPEPMLATEPAGNIGIGGVV